MNRVFSFFLGAMVALLPAVAGAAEGKIVVASKIDTEGALLGSMIASLLEARGLAVENKLQLGPTNIVRAAILAGQIDIYPEYTGNGALFFHLEQDSVWKDRAKGAAKVAALDREQNHLVWLAAAPANNTWTIALRQDLAERHGLKTMGDFAKYLASGGAIKLAALGLTALEDDKGAQVVYAPAPVVREAVLQQHPEIAAVLDPVFATLTLETLQQLNAKIAVEGEDAAAVATAYLTSKQFLP